MNAVQRFFRRYIISTIGIVVLFLAVNIVLFFAILILGSMSGSDAVFPIMSAARMERGGPMMLPVLCWKNTMPGRCC